MAQKYIINDGELILGDVEFHYELLGDRIKNKTIGGGRWHLDEENNIMYFYDRSCEFGRVTEEQFNKSIKPPFINEKKIVFSYDYLLRRIMENK